MVQGKCTECTHCNGFLAQWYRPALCSACFHTIAAHFPGEWNEVKEPSTGKVFFTHTNSGERLFARPADISSEKNNAAVARVRELARQHQQSEQSRSTTLMDNSTLFTTNPVSNQVSMWSNFLDENNTNTNKSKWGNRPPPLSDLSGNIFVDIDEIHGPLLGSTTDDTSTMPNTKNTLIPPSPNRAGNNNSNNATSMLNTFVSKSTTQLLDEDSDDENNTKGTNIVGVSSLTSPVHTTFVESEIPTSPTAVSLSVINSLSLDLGELSRKLGMKDAPVSPSTSPNVNVVPVSPLVKKHSTSGFSVKDSDNALFRETESTKLPTASSSTVGLPLFVSVSTLDTLNTSTTKDDTSSSPSIPSTNNLFARSSSEPTVSLFPETLSASSPNVSLPSLHDTLLLPTSPTVNHSIDSYSTGRDPLATTTSESSLNPAGNSTSTFSSVSSSTTQAISPIVTHTPNNEAPAAPADLAIHLAPIYDDPLIVDVRETAFRNSNQSITNLDNNSILVDGVSVFPIQQPAEESLFFPRYLIVTPFTVMAVAPHPTRLGKGILKWERSILCLADMITQPLFTKLDENSYFTDSNPSDILFDNLPYDHVRGNSKPSVSPTKEPTDNTKKGLVRSLSKSVRNFFDKKESTTINSTVAKTVNKDNGSSKYRMHGIGLLASFVSETPETISFLRSYRAGRRPTVLQGWLYKRKRNAWREKAPLGPLAWKKRWFVLESNMITYYKSSTPGLPPKGMIPLMGWVEVTKAGPDSGLITASLARDATSRSHSFVVRTGNTYHVFQANNAQDSEKWCSAIAINAQYVGANQDEPQCIILPSHVDAENLSKLIAKRREDLLSSMHSSTILSLPRALTVDLSASLVMDSQVRSRLPTSLSPELLHDQDFHNTTGNRIDDPHVPHRTLRSTTTTASSFIASNQYAVPVPSSNQLSNSNRIDLDNSKDNENNKIDEYVDDDNDEEDTPTEGNFTVAEAEALIEAMGGEVTDEILQQLPPSVAQKIAKKYQKQKESTSTGLSSSTRTGRQPSQPSTISPSITTSTAGASMNNNRMNSSLGSPSPILPYSYQGPYGSPLYQSTEQRWIYLDDNDIPQGPFPDSNMRSWLWARYFGPDTLVRCADPLILPTNVLTTLPPNTVDSRQIPQLFLPLSQLFPEPTIAFTPKGHTTWPNSYCAAVMYQGLLASAIELGLDRQAASNAVALLQMHRLPADMSLVLDIIDKQQENANGTGNTGSNTSLILPPPSQSVSSTSSSSSTTTGTGMLLAGTFMASAFLG